jgi:hypothetical protein
MSRSKKRRTLTARELRALASAGLLTTRYSPDGRATVEELVSETRPRPPFGPVVTHVSDNAGDTHNDEGER